MDIETLRSCYVTTRGDALFPMAVGLNHVQRIFGLNLVASPSRSRAWRAWIRALGYEVSGAIPKRDNSFGFSIPAFPEFVQGP